MMKSLHDLPQIIRDVSHLEELLSAPSEAVLRTLAGMEGDFLVLGAAGKMGPTLARMIRRGLDMLGKKSRVIAVSRFGSLHSTDDFTRHGIETIRADLLDERQLVALPGAANVVYMAGMKFGSTNQEALTWAMNVYLPGRVCEKFRKSNIVAFSSGNIYGLTPVESGGSRESDALDPQGDYAMSVLGRERILEHFSRTLGIAISVIRLNYAVEMRYGVIHDIAAKVLKGEAVDLGMGYANVIWQGDANAVSIAAFDRVASPPFVLNVTGAEILSVRRIAEEFGRIFGKAPVFVGEEAATALLNDAARSHRLYGLPAIGVEQIVAWTADWLMRNQQTHQKPTHFEARDGKF